MEAQVADSQPAKRPDPAPGRDQGAEHRPVPKPHGGVEFNGGEKTPGLREADLRRLAVQDLMLDPPDRVKGIQDDGVARDQGVEKMPQAGEGLVLGGGRHRQVPKEATGQAGRHMGEFHVLAFAKLKKSPAGPALGPAGLRIGDPGGEELVGRKARSDAGPLQDRRELLDAQLPAAGFGGEGGKRASHNHLR